MMNQRSISTSSVPRNFSQNDSFQSSLNKNEIKQIKHHFWWFSLIASINHALNYVVTSYSTSLLDKSLSGVILGLSWTLNAVSGLTVATVISRYMGFKYSMILSLFGYAVQIGSLYIAVVSSDYKTKWIIAIIGSSISGFTSAVFWTSQGIYFEHCCQGISKISLENIDSVRSDLSAHWTIIYQMSDILVFLTLSIFPITGAISLHEVLAGLVVVGFMTTVLGFSFENIQSAQDFSEESVFDSIIAVPLQIKTDSRVSLLAPFVFGFGITTAMFAYFVNDDVISGSSTLGTVSLGFMEAFSYFIAVLSAWPYAYVSNMFVNGQDWVIQFGSFSFMLCGIIVLALPNSQLGTWTVVLCIKGLYGLGRGVFEGSCRAVYAKMFTGKDLSTAFSGQTLSAGFSGGICFFLFGILTKPAISSIAIVNGVIAISCYFILMYLVDPTKVLHWSALFKNILFHQKNTTKKQSIERISINSPLLEENFEI